MSDRWSRNLKRASAVLLALAMGFVPDQVWQNIYQKDVALARGTIFADLDKPFIGEEAVSCD